MKGKETSKTIKGEKPFFDCEEDSEMQEDLRLRANYSLAILGEAFVRNGSGSFLNIRSSRSRTPRRI